jgi:hypothetical protein
MANPSVLPDGYYCSDGVATASVLGVAGPHMRACLCSGLWPVCMAADACMHCMILQ